MCMFTSSESLSSTNVRKSRFANFSHFFELPHHLGRHKDIQAIVYAADEK